MKDLLFILILLISCSVLAGDGKDYSSKKHYVDSLYGHLTDQERINQLIWLQGEENTEGNYGGIYLSDPQKRIKTNGRLKAVQLDRELLLPSNEFILPEALLAIEDIGLKSKYYGILRSWYSTQGYDHVILPELEQNDPVNSVLDELINYDSNFFIPASKLSFNPPIKRKEIIELIENGQLPVISSDQISKYERVLRRIARRNADFQENIKSVLYSKHSAPEIDEFDEIEKGHLTARLIEASVTAFLKDSMVLPLRSRDIAVFTQNENFHRSLITYVDRLYDMRTDDIPEGVPVILDARYNPIGVLDYAISLERTNPVIWLGALHELIHVNATAVLVLPQDHEYIDDILPGLLFGTRAIVGRANYPIPEFLLDYNQSSVSALGILGIAQPQHVGMNNDYLDSIQIIANEMITQHAAPGCQVLVAREGNIVLDESYGYLTYDSLFRNHNQVLYDLASVTKVAGTLLCFMDLFEKGQIHLDSSISTYLPNYNSTNKENITLRQLLAHHSGVRPYIPFWKRTLKRDLLEPFYYRSKADEERDIRSYGLHPDPALQDTINNWIRLSPLIEFEEEVTYVYSDIGYMMLQQVIESVAGMSLEEYLKTNFFEPLHLNHITFNPLHNGKEAYEIAPTEYDYYFRKEQVWGSVHDRNAAVFGGIAGHAGLFSNTRDLAVIMQMMLQQGYYDNQQYLDPNTIQLFNHRYFKNNRRGLGWDKISNQEETLASDQSFGHLGFSGTLVWADPEYDLIIIFLSNRIFPNAENNKLNELNIRDRIVSMVYKSILNH